jgi:hypothetical protein
MITDIQSTVASDRKANEVATKERKKKEFK